MEKWKRIYINPNSVKLIASDSVQLIQIEWFPKFILFAVFY